MYPLFSVLCFVKNAEKYIESCIKSVLIQDYPNIEFLIQDGMSIDNTLTIINTYIDKIKLVSESDTGPGDAFMRVLKRAKGEYFCFTLSDEQLMPGALMWAYDKFKKHPEACCVYGDQLQIRKDGSEYIYKAPLWSLSQYVCRNIAIPISSSFFNMSMFRKTNYKYNGGGEFELWVELGRRFSIIYYPGLQSKYRQGGYGIRPDSLLKNMNAVFDALKRLKKKNFFGKEINLTYEQVLGNVYLNSSMTMLWVGNLEEAKNLVNKAIKLKEIDSDKFNQVIKRFIEKKTFFLNQQNDNLAQNITLFLESIAKKNIY